MSFSTKPISPDLLKDTINKYLKKHINYGKTSRIQICIPFIHHIHSSDIRIIRFRLFCRKNRPRNAICLQPYIAFGKPILVIINILLFFWLAYQIQVLVWIPLLGLLINYGYITSMYQVYNSTKYANDTQLKIVTYNVHSFGGEITGFSAKEFADILNKEGVDVLCFQEYRGNGEFHHQRLI